jgi:membrane protease YdiL (CAAX protease family)
MTPRAFPSFRRVFPCNLLFVMISVLIIGTAESFAYRPGANIVRKLRPPLDTISSMHQRHTKLRVPYDYCVKSDNNCLRVAKKQRPDKSFQFCRYHFYLQASSAGGGTVNEYEDDKSSQDDTSRKNILKNLVLKWKNSNFQKGFCRIHDNYLQLVLDIWVRAVLLSFLFPLTAHWLVRREQGARFLHFLVQTLLRIDKMIVFGIAWVQGAPFAILWSILLFYGLVIPYRLLVKLQVTTGSKAPLAVLSKMKAFASKIEVYRTRKIHQYNIKAAEYSQTTALQRVATTSLLSTILQHIIMGPIMEEIIFRQCLLTAFKPSRRANNPTNDGSPSLPVSQSSSSKKDSSLVLFGYTPWVVISSLIFGLAHLSNWIRPLEGLDLLSFKNLQERYTAVLYLTFAMAQSTSAFLLSVRVLSPMFEQHGLAASIGSHITWNFMVMSSAIGIPLRLFFRLLHRLRHGNKNRNEGGDDGSRLKRLE